MKVAWRARPAEPCAVQRVHPAQAAGGCAGCALVPPPEPAPGAVGPGPRAAVLRRPPAAVVGRGAAGRARRRAARCAWAPWKARRRPGCRRCWRPTTRPGRRCASSWSRHLGRAGGQGARLRTRSGLRGRALSRRGLASTEAFAETLVLISPRLARDRRRAGAGRSHGDRLRVRLFLSPHPGVLARPRRRGAGQGDGVRVLSRDRRLRGGRYGRGHRAALRAGCWAGRPRCGCATCRASTAPRAPGCGGPMTTRRRCRRCAINWRPEASGGRATAMLRAPKRAGMCPRVLA